MMMMIRNRFTAVVLKNENQQIAPDTTNRHITLTYKPKRRENRHFPRDSALLHTLGSLAYGRIPHTYASGPRLCVPC